jgi:carbon monoxide dehydrogenase subunit G
MVKLEGQREFSVPVDVLWTKLTDMSFIIAAVPDVKEVKSITADKAELVIQPKLSFIKADLSLTIEQQPGEPNRSAIWVLKTKAIGSSSKVKATMDLTPSDTGATMHWTAAVEELGGLMKLVPTGLMQAAAQKVIGDVLTGVEEKLGTGLA